MYSEDLLIVQKVNHKLRVDGTKEQVSLLYSLYDEELHVLAAILDLLIDSGYASIAFFVMLNTEALCVNKACFSNDLEDYFFFDRLDVLNKCGITNKVGEK